MSLTTLIAMMEEKTKQLNKQERELLEQIETITSRSFANQAAEELDCKKHVYSFMTYLELLQRLLELLQAGMPEAIALESVQTGLEAKEILEIWRY